MSQDPCQRPEAAGATQVLCPSGDLRDGGHAVPFEVRHAGQPCRAFAIRYQGQPQAYLNRCTHVAMEMDYQPNRFFDDSGQWLLCATHGAAYRPQTGECAGGPCRGGLVKITLSEWGGMVHWHTSDHLQPVES
ncbi:MAG: Rieske 2Fe-2S domain-containing protein [Burkholderiaceae bacterium]|nr:Rieske 2Fe-2S domain-containing protein [Burkholderiaceae bacterium]